MNKDIKQKKVFTDSQKKLLISYFVFYIVYIVFVYNTDIPTAIRSAIMASYTNLILAITSVVTGIVMFYYGCKVLREYIEQRVSSRLNAL